MAEENGGYNGKVAAMAGLDMVLAKIQELGVQMEDILAFSTYDVSPDLKGLGIDGGDREQAFLLGELRAILEKMADLQGRIGYLSRPVREVSLLHKNGGMYETGGGYCYSTGSLIEALVADGTQGTPHWVQTKVAHDGTGYYLADHEDVCMDGLTVRVR